MNLLVTGGAGYVGSHACISLLASGHDVMVVDNFSNSDAGVLQAVMEISARRLRSANADIRDREAMRTILAGDKFDAVLHFAALKSAPESIARPEQYWDVNVGGMAILLEACLDAGVNRFVFSSSAIIYGTQESVPVPETAPARPENPYARTKLAGEQILQDIMRARPEFLACCLRYFNPIGNHPSGRIGESPRQPPSNLFPNIVAALRDRTGIDIYGVDYDTEDGTAVRDFVHVMDVADGHAAALTYLGRAVEHTGAPSRVFNLGTGKGCSVLGLVRAMERASGKKIETRFNSRRAGDVAVSLADCKASATVLGWQARRSIQDACTDAMRRLELQAAGER